MSNRTLFWMTGLVIASMVLLLLLNSIPLIWTPKTEKYLKYNDVRGMAIEHKQKLYTLNFQQQNDLIGYLNQALPIPNSSIQNIKSAVDYTKIIIYRFGSPDIEITPIEYKNHNLVFYSPDWNAKGLMREVSGGGLENLIPLTFDP